VQAHQFGHTAGLGCPTRGSAKPGGVNELAPRVRGDGGPHEIPNWALRRRLD
jgi:hypothetical protein